MNKEESRQKIAELVAKYEALSSKGIKSFNEANTKQGFILPLFAAMGWDVFDTNEVAMEEAASNKRVDFAFKINGVARFYLEAKPLKADLNNLDYIKQAITYAYSNGVTWAVLTNFEELRLLNAQKSTPFIQLAYKEYLSSFDKLWLLSREAVSADALSKEATQYGALPPLIPIEEKLFKQLRNWRGVLFNQLYHYNDWLKPEKRDEIIEKLFNRLIFIRTAEDRKLEERNLLAAINNWKSGGHKKGELTAALRDIFADYTNYYDSDLFKEHLLDSEQLYIDEYVISDILNGLYEIPGGMADYDFSIIDADVLGRVYEQYLGYVAKIEQEKAKEKQVQLGLGFVAEKNYQMVEKKIHRKEQGIYYTPKFVTDFIVKETVGRFIQENEADGYNKIRNMKILDPACGSGSFLIRAYDELLNYHARVRGKGANELAQQDRMPILTGNIFGVDLDRQAVEIARLNLLLRGLAKRDHLPPLTDNIKQGNSLISGTEKDLEGYFGNAWKEKHPFNWEYEFKDIMAGGGFDVVIGNPPYVSFGLRGVEKANKNEDSFLRNMYQSSEYKLSTYSLFLEKGIQLLKVDGYLGFILPDSFLLGRYFSKIRRLILDSCSIREILMFANDFWVGGTVGRPVIIILRKENPKDNEVRVKLCRSIGVSSFEIIQSFSYGQGYFENVKFNRFRLFFDDTSKKMAEKIESISLPATEMVSIHTGVRSRIGQKNIVGQVGGDTWKKGLISGSEVKRYALDYKGNYINIDPKLLYAGGWNKDIISQQKLLIRQTGDSLIATLDADGYYHLNNLHSLVLKHDQSKHEIKYILALFNSKLLNHYYHLISLETDRVMAQTDIETLEQLPLRQIDFTVPAEKEAHDTLVSLVEKMLELNKKLAPIRNLYSHERDELVKEIENTDREIDNLVYDLYDLDEEERKIVEAKA